MTNLQSLARFAFAASAVLDHAARTIGPHLERFRAPALVPVAPPAPRRARSRKAALPIAPIASIAKPARKPRAKTEPASDFAPWADYDIRRYRVAAVGPTCVVRFADGGTYRMTTASLPGKPWNVGRGLRNCVAAWRSRNKARNKIFNPSPRVDAIHFERDGETVATFNPDDANRALRALVA